MQLQEFITQQEMNNHNNLTAFNNIQNMFNDIKEESNSVRQDLNQF